MPPTPARARAKTTPKSATTSPPSKDWGGELAQIRGRILAGDLRLSDLEKQLAETQKLTKNFDEFARQFVKQQRSVDERLAQLGLRQEGSTNAFTTQPKYTSQSSRPWRRPTGSKAV